MGALVPVVPYLIGGGVAAASAAVGFAIGALFVAGASMNFLTRRGWLYSGLRMVLVGGGAALVTFGIGKLLGVTTLG